MCLKQFEQCLAHGKYTVKLFRWMWCRKTLDIQLPCLIHSQVTQDPQALNKTGHLAYIYLLNSFWTELTASWYVIFIIILEGKIVTQTLEIFEQAHSSV